MLCLSPDSMDSFSRSDVDFADVEAVKYITSVPAPKRHRKKKHGKNRQNQNPFPAEKQSRARPLKSHEVRILLVFAPKVQPSLLVT